MAKRPDPTVELRELEASLRETPAPGYVLRGPEPWFRERGLALLRAAAEVRGMELCAHDGKDPDHRLSSLIDDLGSAALFATERFVVMRSVDASLKKDGARDSALTRAVLSFLAREGAGTVVVASEGLRADHAVAKAVKKGGGRLVDCRRLYETPFGQSDPRGGEVCPWLMERARAAGVQLSLDQAAHLVRALGGDLFGLDAEVEKLRSTGSSEILGELGLSGAGKPWQVADDLAAGRFGDALFGLESLFQGGMMQQSGKREVKANALVAIVLGSLVRTTRSMLAAAEALEAGADPETAVARAGSSSRRPGEFARSAQERPAADWAAMLVALTDLELRSKSGGHVDGNDLAAFALRWRARKRRQPQRR